MADVRSSQVVAQVEWQVPSLLVSTQVIAQVEYVETEAGVCVGDITFGLTPESDTIPTFVCTGDISFLLTPGSDYGSGNSYNGDISFSLIPESDILQTIVYDGDISFSFTPESDIIGDYCYDGLISFDLIPESAYATPIIGFDWYSGYGLIDLTFLDGNPPYHVVEGDTPVTVTPVATIELYAELEVEATGGVNIAGEGSVEFETPPVYEATGVGGVCFGGQGTVEYFTPGIFELVASGEVEFNGIGVFEFVTVVDLPVFELVASGGVGIAGYGDIEFPELVIYEFVGSGGIEVLGAGVEEFPALPGEFVVVASGGVKINSESVFEFYTPAAVVFELIASGGVEVGGEGIFVYTRPLAFEVVGDGGVEVGGEVDADLFHTWAIIGPTFEPSVYSGFDFNSYSEYQGKCYGLKSDGLYLLEGDTDNGEVIHAGVNFGANNFGKEGRHRLRSIRFGDRDGDDINIKVKSDVDESFAGLSRNRKAVVNRLVFGDDLDVSIADFETLGSMELAVVHRK